LPRARQHPDPHHAAERLVRTAPLVSRWIERVRAGHDPPFTVAQYLALQAISDGEVVGAELARRAAVSPAATSQLLAALEAAGMVTRDRRADDRRRQSLGLTDQGRWALSSAQTALRERLGRFLADLRPAETEALARLLEQLESSLSGMPPPPRPPRPAHRPKRGKRP
jgi:DNA-binding MarR family transcriptional regulator